MMARCAQRGCLVDIGDQGSKLPDNCPTCGQPFTVNTSYPLDRLNAAPDPAKYTGFATHLSPEYQKAAGADHPAFDLEHVKAGRVGVVGRPNEIDLPDMVGSRPPAVTGSQRVHPAPPKGGGVAFGS